MKGWKIFGGSVVPVKKKSPSTLLIMSAQSRLADKKRPTMFFAVLNAGINIFQLSGIVETALVLSKSRLRVKGRSGDVEWS